MIPRMSLAAAVLAAVAVVAGCAPSGASGGTSGAASTASTPHLTQQHAAAILAAAHLGDAASINALNRAIGTPTGAAAAAQALKSAPQGDLLWAATYVYANSGRDPAPLRPLLQSTDSSIRLLAAAGTVHMGDASGFDVLVAELTDATTLVGSAPPTAMWVIAAYNLIAVTHQNLGPDATADDRARASAQGHWRGWFDAHRSMLHFDSTTGLWAAQ